MAAVAKQAVSSFLGRPGHKTTVDESVAPAITNETVKPHRHENITTAVDREVHQDHHHTTVQPLNDRQVLPEEHSHNMAPVEHKTFEHGNDAEVRSKLEQEAARFKNTSTTHNTTHSQTVNPTAESERVHHHIHEHVQPVIHKETVAPKVVHTTVPIHETHHAAAEFHGVSTLPAKTLHEFKSAGGVIDGKGSSHHGEYDGCPRPYNKDMQNGQTTADRDVHEHIHGLGQHKDHAHQTTGLNNHQGTGLNNHHGTGLNKTTSSSSSSASSADNTTAARKPGLMARLNPMKDADGDGKKGFMD